MSHKKELVSAIRFPADIEEAKFSLKLRGALVQKTALSRLRKAHYASEGSMPLALMLVAGVLILAVSLVSVFAYQVAGDRREETNRRAQWAMDSLTALITDQIGVSGRTSYGFPTVEPEEYAILPDGAQGKWWIAKTDRRENTPISLPTIPTVLSTDGSTWILVGETNQVYRSNDGDTWTPTGVIPGAPVNKIVSLDNILIALPSEPNTEGTRNPPKYSGNGGVSWTDISLPGPWEGTETTYDAACSSSSCIIVAEGPDGGRAYRSPSGFAWQIIAASPSGRQAITYGDEKYVSVGNDEISVSYNDGLNWTNLVDVPTGNWNLAGYGNETYFIAEKDTPTSVIYSSVDGATWEASALPSEESLSSIGSATTSTVLMPTSGNSYLINNDGKRWMKRTLPNVSSWLGAAQLLNIWLLSPTDNTEGTLVPTDGSISPLPTSLTINMKVKTEGSNVPFMGRMNFTWNGQRWAISEYNGIRTEILPPNPPEALNVVSEEPGEVILSWAPPLTEPESPITDYTVYLANQSSGPWFPVAAGIQETTYTIPGLIPGDTYWFRVTAANWAGEGSPSPAVEGP